MNETDVLIGGAVFIVGNIVISFAVFTYVLHLFDIKKTEEKGSLEMLKNALLSMAMTIVYSDNIDRNNYNYDGYDGSCLPPLSGADIVNGYMSYMIDSDNPHIHAKFNAIQRFIHSNLISEGDQERFLEIYISSLNNIIDNVVEMRLNDAEDADGDGDDEATEAITNHDEHDTVNLKED